MIRQVRNQTAPVAGSTPALVLDGPWFGWRLTPSAGQPSRPLLVTIVNRGGGTEAPILYDPARDGWVWSEVPIYQLQVTSADSATALMDATYATAKGDRASMPGSDHATAPPTLIIYDSGLVLAGALIQSTIIDVGRYSHVTAHGDNTAGDAIRALQLRCYVDSAGSYQHGSVSVNVAIGASAQAINGPVPYATGLGVVSGGPGPFVRVQLVAGGTGSARVVVVAK